MVSYYEFRNTLMNFGFINYNSIYVHLKNVRYLFCLYLEQERKWSSESRMCLTDSDLAETLGTSPESQSSQMMRNYFCNVGNISARYYYYY